MTTLLTEAPEPALAEEVVSEAEARFEHWRRGIGAVLAPGAFVLSYVLLGDSLRPEGRSLAAVLAAICCLWVTETLSLPVTALLGACLCVLLGVADAKTVFAPFADPIVLLFLGSFLLAEAMMVHGLNRRLALAFLSLSWVRGHPLRLLAAVGLSTALISMWVSNTATAAMMTPIVMGIVQSLHALQRRQGSGAPANLRSWPFASAMMLMVAYGASIGGIGTPVGSPPNLIGIGLIRSLAGVEISFFQWMTLTLPLLAVMGLVLFLLLRWLHPEGVVADGVPELTQHLAQERQALGGWTWGQINTLLAFGTAVTLWVLPGLLALCLERSNPVLQFFEARLPEAVVALLAAVLLFILPTNLRQGEFTLCWEQAVKIDWGTLLLFGGGLSLGTLMFRTGVAEALGRTGTELLGVSSLWGLTAAAVALGILLSEATSNTAAANMVIPVVIALAQAAGIPPVPPALGACLGASFGFMLPVSTPPNAIVYGTGLVPITRMIRAGFFFDLCGFVIIASGLTVLCPLLGLM